ncbi:hypothetical protein VNO77_42101 [Canavalia gladiata]|uniref:Uncharacterized protein n=1 Tax=Canavalia gladiata TaxID=3824 RepID=A0AAN9PT35_CANGL
MASLTFPIVLDNGNTLECSLSSKVRPRTPLHVFTPSPHLCMSVKFGDVQLSINKIWSMWFYSGNYTCCGCQRIRFISCVMDYKPRLSDSFCKYGGRLQSVGFVATLLPTCIDYSTHWIIWVTL